MTFRTQRLVNNFPTDSQARRDPSSFASRYFSVFADYLDYQSLETKKIGVEGHLLKWHLGLPWIWRVLLDEDNQMPVDVKPGGKLEWEYPTTVTGVHAVDGTQVLSRIESIEQLLWSIPTGVSIVDTIAYTDNVIWDSNTPTVYGVLADPQRLEVLVTDSTDYYKKTLLTNVKSSGEHLVIIEGTDFNWIPVKEYCQIRDDGRYVTKNIWRSISSVEPEGFDGRVRVAVHLPVQTDALSMIDPYHLVASDQNDGPLKLGLSNSILSYTTQRLLRGTEYRNGDLVVDNDELVWEQHLAKEDETVLSTVLDIAIHPDTGYLYALSERTVGPLTYADVNIYEHGFSAFVPPVDQDDLTLETFIEIHPLKHWAMYNEEMSLYTRFQRVRHPIVSVVIKRRSPSGTVEYLQADRTTWGALYTFDGKNLDRFAIAPEDTWQDIKFTSTFDEYGQWEFYCTTRTRAGTHVYYTGVMVDKLVATSTLNTLVQDPVSLFFAHDGRLVIDDGSTLSYLDLYSHVYLASGSTQELFLREEYTSVEVVF